MWPLLSRILLSLLNLPVYVPAGVSCPHFQYACTVPGSFSKFQSDALLKNVNLKAHNHLASLTDSKTWLAQNDGT